MDPSITLSWTKWQLISMCLVCSWKVGGNVNSELIQIKGVGKEVVIPQSCNSGCIHTSSLVIIARARYSALVEVLDMIDCFLALQDIKDSPRNMQKIVIDFLDPIITPISVKERLKLKRWWIGKNSLWAGLFWDSEGDNEWHEDEVYVALKDTDLTCAQQRWCLVVIRWDTVNS